MTFELGWQDGGENIPDQGKSIAGEQGKGQEHPNVEGTGRAQDKGLMLTFLSGDEVDCPRFGNQEHW